MCGIAGMLRLDARVACRHQLGEMIAQLQHRGPDAVGVFVDQSVGLAHARLSIIDLENGRQPMQVGPLTITFNGEIFNYIELREALTARGHRFRTQSDTEVILHSYQEYGPECVQQFNGQWAFAIWDRERQSLFLSRDRFGIRPLFYTHSRDKFLFASEIKSLFVHREVSRELDPRGLSQLFTFWSTLAPTTVFRDVHELPPGHNLFLREGDIGRATCYWHLDYAPPTESEPADAWARRLRWLLEDATRLRLRADVPVGAYLSGGLDSSITAALARQISGDRLQTFSLTFRDSEFDESGYQRQVADMLGVQHHGVDCTPGAIAACFPDLIWHTEKPVLRTAPAPLYLLSRRVHQAGLKVVLTGEGSDELLGGYDLFKEAKVRRFMARLPRSDLRAALLSRLYPYLPAMQAQSASMRRAFFQARPETLASPFFSHLPRWQMTRQLHRLFAPDFLPPSFDDEPYAVLRASLPDGFTDWSPFCQAQYLETTILMPGYILSSQGDRAAMAHSVESRYPFLDHRLAEFAAGIPPRLKMKGLNEKYLLKQATADLVPSSVTTRTKQPYRAPDAKSFFSDDWQTTRADYVDELLSEQRLRADGVFHPAAVAHLLEKVRRGQAVGMRDNMAVVGLLSTQLLIEQFVRNHVPSGSLPIVDTAGMIPDVTSSQAASVSHFVTRG
ncbi:MAG: asparagine synthase (glutamine-hydrolyzing) [Pirellulales bacterium]